MKITFGLVSVHKNTGIHWLSSFTEGDNLMKKEVKKRYPVFQCLDGENSQTIREMKEMGIEIKTEYLPGKGTCVVAIYETHNEEQQDGIRKLFNSTERKERRDRAKMSQLNVSYETIIEESHFDIIDFNSPEDIVMNNLVLEKLFEIVEELTEEKKRIVNMIAFGEKERTVAKELGVSQTTLNYRKKKLIEELREKFNI